MFNRRVLIFTGHFGSGKTEVAVNCAMKLAQEYKMAIMDFDIVNPYFRTADAREVLVQKGINIVSSIYANTNVDVPAVPAEINSLFIKKDQRVVLDVGGDDIGARALSAFKDQIQNDDSEMYFVVNVKRPMTDNPEKIEKIIGEIEASSRLKVTSLINNTNILKSSTGEEILEGQKILEKVSSKLGIPIAFTSGFNDIIDKVRKEIKGEVFIMDKFIKLPWE
ncbi:MAG TPA: hypothetical protein VIO64_17845 [Pseudobacteroides sp.]|uniref:hypothetical protein n=1 Tax=Pseudobacteroides sp. TaxID=1968840 RepID=UPI002F95E968